MALKVITIFGRLFLFPILFMATAITKSFNFVSILFKLSSAHFNLASTTLYIFHPLHFLQLSWKYEVGYFSQWIDLFEIAKMCY